MAHNSAASFCVRRADRSRACGYSLNWYSGESEGFVSRIREDTVSLLCVSVKDLNQLL